MCARSASFAVLLLAAASAAGEPAPADLERELRAWLAAGHRKLADRCVQDDLAEEARAEFLEILRADPGDAFARRMGEDAGPAWVLGWDEARHEKYRDYRELRRIHDYEASSRFLALGAAKEKKGDAAGAKAAYRRALDYDPDFADAHARLGEERVEGQGWFPKAEAEKRAQGLLPFEGRWLPAAEVAQKRRRWADAWEVAGPNFTVRSNHSIEAARAVLGWAEEMHAVLVRETAPVLRPPAKTKPMPVFLFATKDDYDAHVREKHPGGVAPSALGFYSNEDGAAHFWFRGDGGPSPLASVVRHECCHQVLDAWIPWKEEPTRQAGFWIYEGLARWFESVENRDGKLLAGNPRHPPFQSAKALVVSGRAASLAALVRMEQPEMSPHYDTAAGATLFFMSAGDARYREKFLRYCRAVLAGEGDATPFEKAFGEAPEEFETAWREYLRSLK